jgi:Arginase/agmatinase/formimionoglutamate hydrolase, arginase family
MKFAVITLPYSVDGWDKGTEAGPEALLQAGLIDWLHEQGHDVAGPYHVELTAEEQTAYGAWNKIGLANAHLARLVSEATQAQAFPLILESNCYGAVGVLAGLQMSVHPPSPRIGMIWIDAHGDCNTPETTLSGMLSGMPVAIATGLCLHRLRKQAGLDPPIAPCDVVMVGVRANDPLEQELIDQFGIEIVPAADVKGDCRQLCAAMSRLSSTVDLIYMHFDVDALDESEVASMWLSEPNGPMGTELGAALEVIMAYPKVAAFGIADINPDEDAEGQMVQSALTVIKGGVAGVAG